MQVTNRLKRRLLPAKVDASLPPPVEPSIGHWVGCRRRQSLFGPDTFRFLSDTKSVSQSADWNRADWPRLWIYNAHYFDDCVADDAAARTQWHRALIKRWVTENPPAAGAGWEPYPISLRVVNWMKWQIAGNSLNERAIHSLAIQVRFLRGSMEYHLLGNHLWANIKALVFAGCFFSGPEAEAWLRDGVRLAELELAEQVLPDGGHFERSAMYHAIVLEDVLDLLQLTSLFPGKVPPCLVARLESIAVRMLRWLQIMTHPDGDIALFNDAAFGIAPKLADLMAYAARQGLDAQKPVDENPYVYLEDSGFIRLQAPGVVALLDVGSVAPAYIPGHAHAGTLGFELSVNGERIFVDSGTSTYAPGPERLAQRGTAAHNTVQVNGLDSSEVWGEFRVARRARVDDVEIHINDKGCVTVHASHDGYTRLRPGAIHHRHWQLCDDELVISDELFGRFNNAIAHWCLASGVIAEHATADDLLNLQSPGGKSLTFATSTPVSVTASQWHSMFGKPMPNLHLASTFGSPTIQTKISWSM